MTRTGSGMLIALVLLLLCVVPAAQADAPEVPPTPCPYTDGIHYQANLAFAIQGGTLRLVDAASGAEIRVLDTDFLSYYWSNYRQHSIYWAPNCRYVVAYNVYQPAEPYPLKFTSIYDVLTGARIFHSGSQPWWFELIFSPTQEQFLIKSREGISLMSESLAQPVLLFDGIYYGNAMRHREWDTARGQVILNFWLNAGYMMVFDANTGATIAAIKQPDVCTPVGLDAVDSTDNRYLIVYTVRGNPACVSIYDRDAQRVVAEINAETYTATRSERMALSPSGRYLVIGLRALRIWDLWNQPDAFLDRLPVYRHEGPLAIIQSLRFVDDTTVETISADGTRRWDILTGAQVGETS